jgi:hypothetical protein
MRARRRGSQARLRPGLLRRAPPPPAPPREGVSPLALPPAGTFSNPTLTEGEFKAALEAQLATVTTHEAADLALDARLDMAETTAFSRVSGLIGDPDAATPAFKYRFQAQHVVLRQWPTLGPSRLAVAPVPPLTNDLTITGAGGKDIASFPDGWAHYYFIAKADGSSLSTLATQGTPVMPPGYTHLAYAGALRFQSGALVRAYMRGAGTHYAFRQGVLSGITIPAGTSTVSLAALVPPNALAFGIDLFLHNTTAGLGQVHIAADDPVSAGQGIVSPIVPQAVSGVAMWCAMTATMPNVGQALRYLSSATGIVFYLGVTGFRVPNGGE